MRSCGVVDALIVEGALVAAEEVDPVEAGVLPPPADAGPGASPVALHLVPVRVALLASEGGGASSSGDADPAARQGRFPLGCERLQRAVQGRKARVHRLAVAAALPRGGVLAGALPVLRAVPQPSAPGGEARRPATTRGTAGCRKGSRPGNWPALLPGRMRWSPRMQAHVLLPLRFERRAGSRSEAREADGAAPSAAQRLPGSSDPAPALDQEPRAQGHGHDLERLLVVDQLRHGRSLPQGRIGACLHRRGAAGAALGSRLQHGRVRSHCARRRRPAT